MERGMVKRQPESATTVQTTGNTERNGLRVVVLKGLLPGLTLLVAGFCFLGLACCGWFGVRRGVYALGWIAAFIGMALAVRQFPVVWSRRRATTGIVAAGLLLRLLFLWSWPADSDVNRYIVEGALQEAGANPYQLAPGDPAVAALLPEAARPVLAGVNHKELSAAYPPLAQLYCRLIASFSPRPRAFKIAAVLADMATCLVLAGTLARLRLPARLLVLYAANPLVLVMTAGEGHLDVALTLCLALALHAFAGQRAGRGFFWLGAAAMVKYQVVVLVAFFLCGRKNHKILLALAPLLLFGLYAAAGWRVFDSLRTFAGSIAHGGSLVAALLPFFPQTAPFLSMGLGAFLLAVVWLTFQDTRRSGLVAMTVVLACLPMVYPWYGLTLVPLWLLYPGWAWWWLLTGLGLVTTPTWLRGAGLGGEGWLLAMVWLGAGFIAAFGWRRSVFLVPVRCFVPVRRLSVVVPTRNEAGGLGRCLEAVTGALGAAVDVVVADGGSTDATVAVALEHGARVVAATGGRGGQITAGVAACAGDVVLVVHADALCRPGVGDRIFQALNACPEAAGGAVGMDFQQTSPGLWILARLNALRAWTTGISFGDQGQFFRREALALMGGFPAMALMEDVELALRLRAVGETVLLGGGLTVSGRRWIGTGFGGKVAGVLRLFIGYLAERRLGLSDPTGWRYYRLYYGPLPHQTEE